MSTVDMRILVDAGNTSTKWQLRHGGNVVDGGQGDLRDLRAWVSALGGVRDSVVAVSCVRDDAYALELLNIFFIYNHIFN